MNKSFLIFVPVVLLLTACGPKKINSFSGADLLKWTAEAPTTECKLLKRRIDATDLVNDYRSDFSSPAEQAGSLTDRESWNKSLQKRVAARSRFQLLTLKVQGVLRTEHESRCPQKRGWFGG